MALNILVVAAYLAVFLCIPLLIGVYVYRDAARRGMNAALCDGRGRAGPPPLRA